MKVVIVALCVLFAARAVRAEEIHPAFEGLERGADALETFRLNALGIVSSEVTGVFPTFVIGGKSWRPVRGKFRYETRYDDFFRMMGRPDLAEQHQRRYYLSESLYWSGVAAFVGGGALLFTSIFKDAFDTRAKVGLGLMGGGLTATIVSAAIQPPLVSDEDARQMATEYNPRLKVNLGLEQPGPRARLLVLSGRL
jgi:hypothetical protein